MKLNQKLTRIRTRATEVMNDGGAKGLWFAGLAEIGYRRLVVREFSLRHPVKPVSAEIELSISRLGTEDIEAYNGFRRPRNQNSARERMANGDVCFVARHYGAIVCACWMSKGKAWSAYLSAPISLASDEAYAYDLYTSPEWRGRNIPAALTSEMNELCRKDGFTRMIGLTIPENRPAMTQRIGYRPIGMIGFIGVGKHRRFFCRMKKGERPPGQPASADPEWDTSVAALAQNGHYLDDFLARMKRDAYLDLIRRWGNGSQRGFVLKTDLFEEAMGPDAFLLDLHGPDAKLIGMDVSEIAATMARGKDGSRKAVYIRADTRALPFSDNSIGMIVSPSTLDHFAGGDDLRLSLNELRRVLGRDGRMIITLDNRQNIFDPLLRLVNMLGRVPYFLGKSYTIDELCRCLDDAGFDVLDTTAIVHHPRLVGVASVGLANRIGVSPVTQLVHKTLLSMQKLQGTRVQYFSGCFVAALAVPRTNGAAKRSVSIGKSDRRGIDA